MLGYLKRLVTTGAAYQAADVVSRVFALVTLPLYLHHLTPGDYGVAETIVTFAVLLSIPLRLGLSDALVRFWYLDEDRTRQTRLARNVVATVGLVSTAALAIGLVFAGPLSEALLGFHDSTVMGFGLLGLWAFSNLEVSKSLLRVEERWRAFLAATVGNVVLSVILTVSLVVIRDEGATGLVAGNFVGSAVTVVVLWFFLARYFAFWPPGGLRPLLAWGLPTVPADAAVFALNVVDRLYLLRTDSPRSAGLYALSIKVSSVVIVAVRGFQYAWPPLAYSVTDDEEAKKLYGVVTTWYLAVTGFVVAGVTLLGRWVLRLFFQEKFFDAYQALPWVALGWALSGLFLVFVVVSGRLGITSRNVPAAVGGLAANILLLVLLVDPLGIAGAGLALCGAYVVMLLVLWLLTRRRFAIGFERGRLLRLALVLGGGTVAGELLLPTSGAGGFVSRALVCAALPVALVASGFLSTEERERALAILPRANPTAGG